TSTTSPASSKSASSTRVPSRPSRVRSSFWMRTAHLRFRGRRRSRHGTSVAVRAFRHAADAAEALAGPPTSRSTRFLHPLNLVESQVFLVDLRSRPGPRRHCAEPDELCRSDLRAPVSFTEGRAGYLQLQSHRDGHRDKN